MIEYKNIVDKSFQRLAEYYKIEIDYKWKAELTKKIGIEIGIKKANRISQWIKRGVIPDNTVNKIIKLNIPEDLENLFRDCISSPGFTIESTIKKHLLPLPGPPESTTSDKSIHGDELFEKISDFLEYDALKEILALFLANLLNDVIYKLIQDEIKEKNHLADLVDQFKNITINVKPPEGVEERRACAKQIDRLLKSKN